MLPPSLQDSENNAPLDDSPCALVTGGSGGIGRAIALSLAARGVRVVVHYGKHREAAEETVRALGGKGHGVISTDLSKPELAAQLWVGAEAQFGPIDLLINNAGIYELHPPLDIPFEQWSEIWQRTLDVNLLAPAHLSFFAAKAMASRRRGRIVAVSSRGAFRGEPSAPAYGASKAGLNALSQSLAKALAPHNVGVFVVAPGWVLTEMAAEHLTGERREAVLRDQPSGRVADPDEVAKVVEFCALDAPLSMTGAILDVNGASYLRT